MSIYTRTPSTAPRALPIRLSKTRSRALPPPAHPSRPKSRTASEAKRTQSCHRRAEALISGTAAASPGRWGRRAAPRTTPVAQPLIRLNPHPFAPSRFRLTCVADPVTARGRSKVAFFEVACRATKEAPSSRRARALTTSSLRLGSPRPAAARDDAGRCWASKLGPSARQLPRGHR